jgi:hypothetical protein
MLPELSEIIEILRNYAEQEHNQNEKLTGIEARIYNGYYDRISMSRDACYNIRQKLLKNEPLIKMSIAVAEGEKAF